MKIRSILALGSIVLAGAIPAHLAAQDAAESATIVSGQAGAAKAQRNLGTAVSGSLRGSASAIRTTARPRNRRVTYARNSRKRRAGGAANGGNIILDTNDPLAGTDARAYQTGSGTTIRVSGRLNPSASTRCVENCAKEKPES